MRDVRTSSLATAFVTASLGACALMVQEAAAQSPPSPTALITSVKSIDAGRHQAVFPLHRGTANGHAVWYILTDVSDEGAAKAQGLDFAPALSAVRTTQTVAVKRGTWQFAAAPDFSPARVFQGGPSGFPPAAAAPGATAPLDYSPLVRIGDSGPVYNAPIVAVGDGPFDVVKHTNTADRVLALDAAASTVTLLLADGFADGKRVLYISTEASDPGAAAIERALYLPAIADVAGSARLPIYVIANGPTGRNNATAQGLAFAALDGNLSDDATAQNSATLQSSRNILSAAPGLSSSGAATYTPLWNVYLAAWTAGARAAHHATQLKSAQDVAHAVAAGDLAGPNGKKFGPAGFAVNCPIVAIFK